MSSNSQNYGSDNAGEAAASDNQNTANHQGTTPVPTSEEAPPTAQDNAQSAVSGPPETSGNGNNQNEQPGTQKADETTSAGGKKRTHEEAKNDEPSEPPAKRIRIVLRTNRESTAIGQQTVAGPSNKSSNVNRKSKKSRFRHRVEKNPLKHAGICRPGIKFRWSDNRHVDETPIRLGEPDKKKLRLQLKSTTGKWFIWPYVKRDTFDKNNKAHVMNANKWRNQVIDRRLNDKAPGGESHTRAFRPHWSEREMTFLENLIFSRIQRARGRLTGYDWKKIAKHHNAKFVGETIQVGEKLPPALSNKGTLSKGGVLKNAHVLPERTVQAIQTQASRWPMVREMMEEEYNKFNAAPDAGNETPESDQGEGGEGGEEDDVVYEGEGPSDEEDDEEEEEGHGGEIKHGLEDPSDDEDEHGNIPASTQGPPPIAIPA